MNFISEFFSSDGFMPHGHCYLWDPPLVWLHVISDSLIALAYLTIPLTLTYIARKRKDLPFDWIFACFAVFILACGTTHALEVWTLWIPTYWLSGTLKAVTAVASITTAFLLIKLVPRLLAIPSPAALQQANRALGQEAAERERIEEDLYRNKTELRVLLDFLPAMICFKDTENRILRGNQRFADHVGKQIAEIEGKSFVEILPAEASALYEDDLKVIHSGLPLFGIVEASQSQGGEIIWLQKDKVPVFDPKGKVTGIVVMAQDITARKRVEGDLRWKTAFLEAQVNSSIDGILVVDAQGTKLLQSQKMTALLQIPPHIADDPDDGKQLQWVTGMMLNPEAFLEKVVYLNTHQDEVSRDEIALKDGTFLDRYSSPVIGKDKTYYGRIWIFREITQRKQAEALLAANEVLLRQFVQHTPAAIAMMDLEMRFIQVSDRWIQDYHLTGREIIGHSHYEIFPDVPQRWKDIHQRVLAGAVERCDEDPFPRADGSIEWLQWEARPWRKAGGEIGGLIFFTQVITERKRAEGALKESEMRYRSLFENMVEGYAYCRILQDRGRPVDYIYLNVNSAFEPLTGLKNVIGKKVSEVVPGIHETNPEQLERYSRVASTGILEKFETFVVPLGIWFSVSVYSQEKGYFVAIFNNITERKNAETEIRFNAQRYRTLVEATTSIVWDTPASGVFEVDQPGWRAFTGQSLEELLGWGWLSAIHPDDRAETARIWNAAVATRSTYKVEHRLLAHDHTWHNMMVRGVPILAEDGTILQWIGIHTDITGRERAKIALLESKHFLRSTLDALSSHIAILDEQGTIIEVNTAWNSFARENGFKGGHSGVGDNYMNVCDSASADRSAEASSVADGIRDVIAGRKDLFSLEYPCHGPREKRWFVIHVTRFSIGGLVRVVVAHENITQRKRAEEFLKKAQLELLETSRQAGRAEVAIGVLHNVGNVLNSVNVASTCLADSLRKSKAVNLSKAVTLLREHEEDLAAFLTIDPRGRQLPGYLAQLAEHLTNEQSSALKELDELQKNIEHIKGIVTLQQGFAKVAGITESFSITGLVEDALKINESLLVRQDIRVIREFGQVPPITSEKHRVLQILTNLVGNATQACEELDPPEKRLTLRVAPGTKCVTISVTDNGIGIPAENLTRIFAHGFTTKKAGHGFGLHSGALAAKELGGSLTVTSEGPGLGTTFTLELPCSTDRNLNHA